MKIFLDSRIFDVVVENYRQKKNCASFLRFLADQYESAKTVMEQQERLYVNRDVEESAAWCAAHYRKIVIECMLEEAYI